MNKKYFKVLLFIVLFCLPMKADMISLVRPDQCETIVEVYIEDDQIRVTFEIGLLDLKYFNRIISPEFINEEIKRYALKIANQSEGFIMKADGKELNGVVVKQEIQPRIYRASLYTGIVDENLNISKEVLFTEIVYKLNSKPKIVNFSPPLEEGYSTSKANIGFVTYHKKIPVNDLRYLSRETTLNLNWEDPWYSKFKNRNLRRHHQSSLMSFLYIDPYEVRHEVMIRVKDLEEWMELGYGIDDYIEVEELGDLKTKIADFLINRNIVTIDGKIGKPIVDKVHYVKWSLSGIQILDLNERMDYSSAVIGVIFAYPHEGIPQEVTIDWDMFSENVTMIPNVASDPAGPMPYNLVPDDHILTWTNFLKNYKLPTISEIQVSSAKIPILQLIASVLILLGFIRFVSNFSMDSKNISKFIILGILSVIIFVMGFYFKRGVDIPFMKQLSFSKPQAVDLISHLLQNTYRAFDFREESDVYDKLAISNDQELLADIYLQTKKSMVLESQGGIQVKVKDVQILEAQEIDSNAEGISFKCKWMVKGDVGHWGHIHSRINQYEAILKVHSVEGIWKLNAIDIIEEVRL